MGRILNAVQRGVARADPKAPKGVWVARNNGETSVSVIKQGVVVGVRNWIINTRTGEANCKAYHVVRGRTIGEATLRGDSIEDIIWSVVMAVAIGAYDHVPD